MHLRQKFYNFFQSNAFETDVMAYNNMSHISVVKFNPLLGKIHKWGKIFQQSNT